MTDKQIIIDEVDISGCEFYWREKELCNNGNLTSYCQENKDCLYKKYKRKEQENERLKSELQVKELELIMAKADLCRGCQYKNDYKAKEQECEELKRLIAKQKNAKIQLSKLKDKQYKEFCDMKQTLIEIKEIAEGMHDLWINKTPYTDIDNLVEHLLNCELNRIRYKLDEIGECEVEDTDKQIIIDGVDVSGCPYSKIGKYNKYCEQDLYDDGTPVFTCDEYTNCYYKQLKRKEQECERLKQTLAEIKEVAENAYCLTNYTNKDMAQFAKQILQKISEVENDNK